ncbi:hypothetical protein AAKU52_002593 [Pedobacter sp. CG_S7]|uniref:hypothetical protein n=1 Tax=Pedobacter sp. CG_S7 TaxID=3143930 RepID=UPI0033951CD3
MKKYITLILIFTASIILVSSCSKSDEAEPDHGGLKGKSSYKISYKLILPAKFVGQVVFTTPEGAASSKDDITGTWTSQEYTFLPETAAAITASASASDSSTGEMTIQILESGKVVKEVKSSGGTVSGTADIALQ